MKTQLPIPVLVIENLTDYISQTFPTISEKHKAKLFSKLIELWLHIYDEHQKEISKKKDSFNPAFIDNIYASINTNILYTYTIYIGKQLRYTDLINILEETNLIDVNDTYSSGRFSKSYRPNPKIKYELTETISIDVSKFINNNKSKHELITTYPAYTQLIENMYLVKIDLIGFFNTINNLIGLEYTVKQGKSIILTDKLAYGLKIKAIKIDLGIHFFSVSSTGRIYSSIANLPKLTLPHITLNGQRPVEIDAANCQPLLLSSLVNNQKFKTDCENGEFYDIMANQLGISRQEFKLQSYATIFFNNKKITGSIATQLDTVYPGLSVEINKFKTDSNKIASTLNESEFLWFKLQSLEANIFITTALEQLTPVLTRHDSILCLESQLTEISNQIKKKFKKLNINVTLK